MGRPTVWLLVTLALGGSVAACQEPRRPIRIEGRVLTVENTSSGEWVQVEIWLNDHYRVTRPRMPAGERLEVPLDGFVAGFGQRFDPRRQVVRGIEVTAATRDGTPVTIVWGSGRRR